MVDPGRTREDGEPSADACARSDFRGRMTLLLEDLDAAGETLAAAHLEQALSKLSD